MHINKEHIFIYINVCDQLYEKQGAKPKIKKSSTPHDVGIKMVESSVPTTHVRKVVKSSVPTTHTDVRKVVKSSAPTKSRRSKKGQT
jgi:hypothetical protein